MKKVVNATQIALQIILLYLLCYIGNLIVDWLHLPLPGSIIGLIMLLILLHLKVIPKKAVAKGAGALLSILTLLFIPATVGIVNYPELLSSYGVILLAITFLSTVFALITTALFAKKIEQKEGKEKEVEVYASND
ncbi:putative integral membrane protein YxzK [Kurthia zopfii]|uniref:Holin-like protein n=1 Tax=Kurthia zopfii TaxID=1650 RepID=A0A2U3AC26_9BACL|nr:CidA/LrgA family protein [Kurthia zopfii]PWI22057.1 CidA/LrgA family protein [Kurthia zopfii]TDR36953.1 holin-like protein [Kurthia zopfii]STX08954.1 Holin-like protein CidA [Kurthia zopfii]VEI04834.1 Holin-like protein CidA [Kurthia zopfii]GEK31172.1 putative integral membrane protein YxzK [Kurthia zopfii]